MLSVADADDADADNDDDADDDEAAAADEDSRFFDDSPPPPAAADSLSVGIFARLDSFCPMFDEALLFALSVGVECVCVVAQERARNGNQAEGKKRKFIG